MSVCQQEVLVKALTTLINLYSYLRSLGILKEYLKYLENLPSSAHLKAPNVLLHQRKLVTLWHTFCKYMHTHTL